MYQIPYALVKIFGSWLGPSSLKNFGSWLGPSSFFSCCPKNLAGPLQQYPEEGEVNRLHQYLRAHSLNANAAYNRRACLSFYRSMLSAHVRQTHFVM
jgi:hypothetical protein